MDERGLHICLRCGRANRRRARYCGQCGWKLGSVEGPRLSVDQGRESAQTSQLLDGRYRVVRVLDQGGFGIASVAEDTHLGRTCVVKQLRLDPLWSEARRRQQVAYFADEARILVTLNTPGHPNIPEIYAFLEGAHCLVMKHVTGESLRYVLRRRTAPLAESQALRYMRDVCSALAYMHSRPTPVLHRDLKPANILLDSEDRIWLIDFGLASTQEPTHGSADAQAGPIAGTPGYTPPEQWRGQAQPRSDIFALGATLFELLTQRKIADIASGGLSAVAGAQSLLRPEVARLIVSCLAPRVAERPTAAEVLTSIEQLLANPPIPAPPAPAQPPAIAALVGRKAELALVCEGLMRTRCVVIVGMAGVGKTALAATAASQLGRPSLWHTCRPGEGVGQVFWELGALLAHHGRDDAWRQMQRTRLAGGQPPPPDALADFLLSLMQGLELLICLEDIHHVEPDPGFVRFLQRLQAATAAGHGALLATTRTVPAWLAGERLFRLVGFERSQTEAYMARLGLAVDKPTLERLQAATEGNVQFLTLAAEVMRHAESRAEVVGRLSAAPDVERYLLREIDRGLSGAERCMMEALAVLFGSGTRHVLETLTAAGGALRTLVDLCDRQLLIEQRRGDERVYEQHALVQAFYYGSLSERERRALHVRAAEHFEQDEQTQLQGAWHYARAAMELAAVRIVVRRARSSISAGQAGMLHSILDAVALDTLPPDLRIASLFAHGDALTFLGEHERAISCFRAALDLIVVRQEDVEAPILYARACRGMGQALEYSAPGEARAWLQRGLDALTGIDALEEGLILHRLGAVLIALGEPEPAQHMLERSLHLLPASAQDQRADVLVNLGTTHCMRGATEVGKGYFLEALELCRAGQNRWAEATIWQNLGLIKDYAGDWSGAAGEYRQALELAERLGSATRQTNLELLLGTLATQRGEHADGEQHLRRCIELAQRHSLFEYLVCAQSSLADLSIVQGAWAAAEELLAEVEPRAMQLDIKYQLPEILRSRTTLALAHHEIERALKCSARSLAIAGELDDPREVGKSMRVSAQAALAAGRFHEAEKLFVQSVALLDQHDRYEAARTRLSYGLVLVAGADPGLGARLLAEARAVFEAMGAQREAAAVARALGSSAMAEED